MTVIFKQKIRVRRIPAVEITGQENTVGFPAALQNSHVQLNLDLSEY
jgi:hypothetical protein